MPKYLNISPEINIHFYYAPNFKEVEGAYWFGSIRPVSPVRELCLALGQEPLRARILKFGMWFVYEN